MGSELDDLDLDLLPDDEFRDLVDRELRSGHRDLSATQQQEISEIGMALRTPAAVHRWISVLESMKSSSETQLGAKRADLKKNHGKISEEEYKDQVRQFHYWRAGNMRFLNNLRLRLIEARELRRRYSGPDAYVKLVRAIAAHREHVMAEDYEPTDADKALWATIDAPTGDRDR